MTTAEAIVNSGTKTFCFTGVNPCLGRAVNLVEIETAPPVEYPLFPPSHCQRVSLARASRIAERQMDARYCRTPW